MSRIFNLLRREYLLENIDSECLLKVTSKPEYDEAIVCTKGRKSSLRCYETAEGFKITARRIR